MSGQDASAWALHAAHYRGWSRCGAGSATSSIAAVLLPHVRLSHVAVMAGCDWVGSGSETVGDGGHLQPPSCHCGPLERAPEGGQALFGVPIFLCRLFSGKLSLLFIEIHCVKILRFVSRWTEKRVFCGKTFDYGVPIPSEFRPCSGLPTPWGRRARIVVNASPSPGAMR